MSLDGIVPSLDPEEMGALDKLGSLVVAAEHEGLLEPPELLVIGNLRIDGTETEDDGSGEGAMRSSRLLERRKVVRWSHLEQAVSEPLG